MSFEKEWPFECKMPRRVVPAVRPCAAVAVVFIAFLPSLGFAGAEAETTVNPKPVLTKPLVPVLKEDRGCRDLREAHRHMERAIQQLELHPDKGKRALIIEQLQEAIDHTHVEKKNLGCLAP